MTRYIRANYDCQTNRWQLGKLGLPLSPVPLMPGDLCRLQVLFQNTEGSLAAYTVPLLMFKTYDNYINGGDFTFTANTYDTDDAWHNPAIGQVSIPFIVPYSMTPSMFITGLALFTSAGQKMETSVLRTVANYAEYLGTETNIPVGTPGANDGTVVIAAGNTQTNPVLITGLTATTGRVLAQLNGGPAGFTQSMVIITAGQFVVTVPQPPDAFVAGATYSFTYWVLHL